ncbi:tubulin folding cofactor D C terminal-domain-containing protein [Bombardia bombarda]|uniref:Tubulin folding cofactor D C terminal-domain-containing protein n=1 Tax=Bombardia bombarda TaxID=252184 RepID=A0AA40C9K8_9PEZI|nr:tubulin folding cofactor D C terminal-domain-containing protein [Bombardia bombarda]
MNAPEEDLDIKLQKVSADLITDFDKSLLQFLRKKRQQQNDDDIISTAQHKQHQEQQPVVRSRVRARETDRLVSLLDPFQELPQLLDPQLPKWLPILADAFLEYQQQSRRRAAREVSSSSSSSSSSTRSDLLMPLPAAIAKILYTICKIRGEKVVVRFLRNETRYLELLLSALEDSERNPSWTWEERYVVLLWLSHLMLAPFDLATISSVEVDSDELPLIPGFRWPTAAAARLPGITVRILPLAIKYLASPGKERDAARALLVRVAMRRDMQQLGVLDALVQWALIALRPRWDVAEQTPYHYIGVLSFLSGILVSSSDTSDMDRHLTTLFYTIHRATAEADPAGSMMSSALARKMMIKVIRAITILTLRNSGSTSQDQASSMELVETTIGFLLENLADNDTPVRFAASKALSIVTLKLDADMASQVVEAVIESLNRNVLWVRMNPRGDGGDAASGLPTRTKDLSAVNPLEWHGLMLTLSHLLYRRSPPAENLSDIIHTLLMGLSFERRNTSGGSSGTNVRDAACFGIWALARRYTTAELRAVPTTSTTAAVAAAVKSHNPGASMLQIIATELVVEASLDPAGNIRRGSSAALQELIGRHPDTVEKGIWVVQAVDYHSVALRSRALQEVALGVTRLAGQYGEAVLDALLGWRGIGDADAAARRAAGVSYGAVTAELAGDGRDPVERLAGSVQLVLACVGHLEARQVEERHGLLLSLAAVLDGFPAVAVAATAACADGEGAVAARALDRFVSLTVIALTTILTDCDSRAYRRPELIAEAASRLVVSSAPLLQAAVLSAAGPSSSSSSSWTAIAAALQTGPATISQGGAALSALVDNLGPAAAPQQVRDIVAVVKNSLNTKWLLRSEQEVISAASDAGVVMLVFSDRTSREETMRSWADTVRRKPVGRAAGAVAANGGGYFAALAKAYLVVGSFGREEVKMELDGDGGVVGRVLGARGGWIRGLLDECEGDVGSHVRLQAVRAAKWLWEAFGRQQGQNQQEMKVKGVEEEEDRARQSQLQVVVVEALFLRVLRLAAEKLDRVRVEAQGALGVLLRPSQAAELKKLTFSSKPYFSSLLNLLSRADDWLDPAISAAVAANPDRWMDELMAGLVSSADTGNEDLVIATRAALCDFCCEEEQQQQQQQQQKSGQSNAEAICAALVRNARRCVGQDRVLVPTLEVIAFLFHVGVFARCVRGVDYKNLVLLVQKAGYKTGNVRKIEACIKVYGAVADLEGKGIGGGDGDSQRVMEGVEDARKRLGALMSHPWPRVRGLVVDELWGLGLSSGGGGGGGDVDDGEDVEEVKNIKGQELLGVDWGKAGKGAVKGLIGVFGLDG